MSGLTPQQIGNLIGIILLIPAVFAQFDPKPDVSFTETNDRFDLTGMMQAHPAFRDVPLVDDNEDDDLDSDDDYRRRLNIDLTDDIDVPKETNPEANIEETFLTRKSDGGFAYHDKMDSKEGGTMSEFVENLKAFERVQPLSRRRRDVSHAAGKRFRRNADQVVLSQYGFPIVLKVDGFLKPPLE